MSLDEWNKLVAMNMAGVFLGTKLAAPALREAAKAGEHGSGIVNLTSIAGIVVSQLDPLYSVTNCGVTLFTKSAALEFAHKAIGFASTLSIRASSRRILTSRLSSRAQRTGGNDHTGPARAIAA